MGAYLTLLAILAGWLFIALRMEAQPWSYAAIFGVNILVANITEWLFAVVFDLYSFGGYTNLLLVTVGIEPMLGLLYAHYSRHRPILRAVLLAVALGGPVEMLFLWVGAFQYDRGWHPLLTMICFTGYFLWTGWLTRIIRHRFKEVGP